MNRLFVILLLFYVNVSLAQSSDSEFGKPVFWYRVSDPWGMFMGAEGPVFILYDSGNVLFWKNGTYKQSKLSRDEQEELKAEMGLQDTLFNHSRFIDATNPEPNGIIGATDNPTYSVFLNRDTIVRFSIYGYITSKRYRKHFPQQVLHIHDYILSFDDDKAVNWLPQKIEVLLSDYRHSPEPPIQWPTGWPDLNSPDTRKQEGYATSIFLEKKYFNQLRKLLKERREKQAFAINGKKYFIGYRFPIPGLY